MIVLITTLIIPILGAIAVLFIDKDNRKLIEKVSLGTTLLTFLVSLGLYFSFDSSVEGFQFLTNFTWIPAIDAGFRVGLDGMSLLMVMLTTFISPIALLSSINSIEKRHKEYYFMFLTLQFGMLGVFMSLDMFLFYVFWEVILIPMYFIIGIWGGKDRIYAAVKFFVYTIAGSLFMLIALIWLCMHVGGEVLNMPSGFTTNYLVIKQHSAAIAPDVQNWLFIAFAVSFLIKVPLFPLHTWLPDAHTMAPTPGSVILAAVLLKMGTYGLIRFNLELFPVSSIEWAGVISFLAVVGIIYGALVALVQTDFKKIIAYSSVAHLGFVVLGTFAMNETGIQGAIIQMVNHGLSTGMLFICVGIIYNRRHTREISQFGGLARVMPAFTVFFGIAMFASVGLPGLNGFVGEFLTLVGAFTSTVLDNIWYSIVATTGVIFAACYLLWMFSRIMFGALNNEENKKLKDLNKLEWAMLIPLVIFIVWLGVYPSTFMNKSKVSTQQLVKKIEQVQVEMANGNNLEVKKTEELTKK
jgi:NADH-quinone oxidoreductase subunit M